MSVLRVIIVVVVLVIVSVVPAREQGRPLPAEWVRQLERLDPQRPVAYFELGEEVADAATDESERALARRLFALAGLLDTHLARSAALAVADLEQRPYAKRRLHALAVLLGERSGLVVAWDQRQDGGGGAATPTALEALTDAFSFYRSGFGNKAITRLEQPGTMALLEEIDRHIVGGTKRFLEDCRLYRQGELRPGLSPGDITRMLRLEKALLDGDDRSISGDLLLGGGQPLIEVDPSRLEESFGFDAVLPYYRGGRWVGEI
jgi:hypothetical protein